MNIGNPIEGIYSTTVINPESGETLNNHDITIKGNQIVNIVPSNDKLKGEGMSGSGLFAIPGLIDAHVHALSFLYEEIPGLFDLKWVFRQQKKNLLAYIRSGITTVRDLGSALKLIRKTSLKCNAFKIEGPRIIYAGPIFTVPGGYPYFIDKVSPLVTMIAGPIKVELKEKNSEPQARGMIDKCAANGASCIKVAYQSVKYDDDQTEIPIISLNLLKFMVDYAHKHNLPVAIHCCYRKDFQQLIEATDIKFDSLEHLTIDEPLNQSEVKEFAQRKIPISTTLMTYGMIDHVKRYELLFEQEPERFEQKPIEFLQSAQQKLKEGKYDEISKYIGKNCMINGSNFMRENLKKLYSSGVKILFGTDSAGAVTPPGLPHWEFIDMARSSMSNLDILKSATINPAKVLKRDDLGCIRAGATADLVLLRNNPLNNIEAIKDIAAVIRDGRLIYQPNFKQNL